MRVDLEMTKKIAAQLCYRHPRVKGEFVTMTTDLLVTRRDGSLEAYSIKAGGSLNNHSKQKEMIQEQYWKSQGVPYFLKLKTDLNPMEMVNLQTVLAFYDERWVRPGNKTDVIKHLIATKQVEVDLNSNYINYPALAEEYFEREGKITCK